jgi:ubiquinone biosynthesis accessory factor UbiJ
MPATPAWLASVEALLNRNVKASGQAAAVARRLRGTCMQLDVEGWIRVRASVSEHRLVLAAGDDSAADAFITGSPAALWNLLRANAAGGGGAGARRAQIRGDAEIAHLYRELFALARPDLEEELSRIVGDMPARRIARLARGSFAWLRGARRTVHENIAEYLQEESRDLVNHPEYEEFLRGVDAVRETADRVEARLAGLERRLQGRA